MSENTAKSEMELAPAPTHPEEFKTVFDVRLGKLVSLQGSVRADASEYHLCGDRSLRDPASCGALLRASRLPR